MAPPSLPEPPKRASAWLMACGILFMILWLAGAFALGTMKLMASLMANDSGSISTDAHLGMIAAVMGGQLVSGLAGIPGGMIFFSPGRRKKMTLIFLAMLIGGVAIQAAAIYFSFA